MQTASWTRTGFGTAKRTVSSARGLTIIELLLVVALFGVLAAMSAPSIATLLARKRVDGTAQEVASTVRYARALRLQSPQRTQIVYFQISGGTGFTCAAVFMGLDETACDCGLAPAATCTTNALLPQQPEILRVLQSQDSQDVRITPTASSASHLSFDRYAALPSPVGSTMSATVSSNRGGSLRVDIGATGLPVICEIRGSSGQATHPHYPACT